MQNASLRLRYLLNRLVEDRLNASAAALTFVTLFALVPLLTVTLSIASALPAADNIEDKLSEFLLQFLLPESSTQVVEYLSTFISQARSLTAFGVIILLVSAILMLRNVEKALNDIWRNRANRKPLASFLLYWAVLSLGPAAIGFGLGIRAYLFAATNDWGGVDLYGLGSVLISLLPFVISAMGLTFLYVVVPNCQCVTPWLVVSLLRLPSPLHECCLLRLWRNPATPWFTALLLRCLCSCSGST